MEKHIKTSFKKFTNYITENNNEYYIDDVMKKHYQKKEAFLNSIKTFDDISTDDKIKELISYIGQEGFNDEEDAFDDLKEKIEFYREMSNPVILYRIVGVKNKKMIKSDELGEHYTPYKWNLDGDMLMSIGYEDWDDETKPYVMEVSVPHSEIDIIQTIVQNLSFPNEHEINLKNNGMGAKFIKAYKLKGF